MVVLDARFHWLRVQAAWDAKLRVPEQPQSHICQLEVQIPSTDGWKLGADSKELIFTASSQQKETKWLCCWELLQIAPLWMWWWQHVNFHTYNWLIFKFCIPLWDEKFRRRFLATAYQWCVSELWELCGLLPHYLSVGTDSLALVQVSHPWTLLSALRIAWC